MKFTGNLGGNEYSWLIDSTCLLGIQIPQAEPMTSVAGLKHLFRLH